MFHQTGMKDWTIPRWTLLLWKPCAPSQSRRKSSLTNLLLVGSLLLSFPLSTYLGISYPVKKIFRYPRGWSLILGWDYRDLVIQHVTSPDIGERVAREKEQSHKKLLEESIQAAVSVNFWCSVFYHEKARAFYLLRATDLYFQCIQLFDCIW